MSSSARFAAVLFLLLPAVPVAAGRCALRLDSFKCDLDSCSVRCLGREQCTNGCMAKKGYDCAACYGAVTACTNRNCLRLCLHGCNEACARCSEDKCSPQLASCLGVSLSRIPKGCCGADRPPLRVADLTHVHALVYAAALSVPVWLRLYLDRSKAGAGAAKASAAA